MDDLALPQHHRSGAHRARRHPLLVALVTVGAVAAASAVLVWALLSADVLGVGDDLREAGGVTPPASGAPTADPTGAVPGSAEPSPAASPEPSPVVTEDRTLPLQVLNSTGTSGLAGAAAEVLGDAGWQVDGVGNYDGDETPTVVLYPETPDDPDATAVALATAAVVAADLGAGAPEPSDEVDGLTVVLGPDYSP